MWDDSACTSLLFVQLNFSGRLMSRPPDLRALQWQLIYVVLGNCLQLNHFDEGGICAMSRLYDWQIAEESFVGLRPFLCRNIKD